MKAIVEDFLHSKFHGFPYLGNRPFEIVDSTSTGLLNLAHLDRPQAIVVPDSTYRVYIPCSSQEQPNRFVFQYAHEVAHFYFSPIQHPFLELCAIAVSFSTLTACQVLWKEHGKIPTAYAPKFTEYRCRVEEMVGFSHINTRDDFPTQIFQTLGPKHSREARQVLCGHPQLLAGAMLATVLDQVESWHCLTQLHEFVILHTGLVDFEAWIQHVENNTGPLLIAEYFSSVFGV